LADQKITYSLVDILNDLGPLFPVGGHRVPVSCVDVMPPHDFEEVPGIGEIRAASGTVVTGP